MGEVRRAAIFVAGMVCADITAIVIAHEAGSERPASWATAVNLCIIAGTILWGVVTIGRNRP